MKCQILFSRKNKKHIISLPSAKNAQRVIKVNARVFPRGLQRKVLRLPYVELMGL